MLGFYDLQENLAHGLNRIHTVHVKTSISLPDDLYEDAEQTARALGIPRSQLYARAISEFLKKHRRDQITQKLNDVYERIEKQAKDEL